MYKSISARKQCDTKHLLGRINSNRIKIDMLSPEAVETAADWLHEYQLMADEIEYLLSVNEFYDGDHRKYRSRLSKFTTKINKLSEG